jgi:hypothetical protein
VEPFSFLIAERDDVLLYSDRFGSHKSSPSFRYGTIESEFYRKVKDAGYYPL